MPDTPDPFAHNPELRGRIAPSDTSYFRDFSVAKVLAAHPDLAEFESFAHPDETREAIRAAALAGHEGDLWIFAYGSLMWDPALRFAEVRRAHAPHHARRFVLEDRRGGRGTQEAPGLFAGLDACAAGSGCEGLAFRIAAADVEAETEILFRREMIGPGYLPRFVPARIDGAERQVLAFLADHAHPDIRSDISREEQVRYIATGSGMLGTSRDYLAGIVTHLDHLGIEDAHCSDLLREVDAYRAAHAAMEAAR